jgi:predicted ribosome quality control (RQC) complex YloA/Tae2 family protein
VSPLDADQKQRLLAEVRTLAGALLQKVWLQSPQLCVLQLRVPGKNHLVLLDARSPVCSLIEERPSPSQAAPKSQATLRNALEGARLLEVKLALPFVPWLDFETPRGLRSLLALNGSLLLVDPQRKIWWASQKPPALIEEPRFVPLPAPAASPELRSQALHSSDDVRRRELTTRLKARIVRAQKTLKAVEADFERTQSAAADRSRAELLLPHASRIPRGAAQAKLPDWTSLGEDGAPRLLEVKLDPSLSAQENAARWLKKAKRLQAALPKILARQEDVRRELEQLRTLLDAPLAQLESALPSLPARARKRDAPRLPYRIFFSSSGDRILVGRSAKDNDALTFKVARGNDLWLHVRGIAGSHVIVPGAGDSPDSRTLGDAALLAAHFSSSRGESAAEVAWTRCKYVRKAKGGAPGSVLISQERTLRVRNDPERLQALLRTEGRAAAS